MLHRVDDFDALSFSPPISVQRETLNDFAAFTQLISVESVSAANLEQVVTDYNSAFVRVTVRVYLNAKQLSSADWIRARY